MQWMYLLWGFLVGSYGTLVGVGGGFLLMPLLILLFPNTAPAALTAASLAVIFINTISGSVAYELQKRIDYRSAVIFGIVTIPGAILGAWLVQFIPRRPFELAIGILLGILAIFLLLNSKDYNKLTPRPSSTVTNKKQKRVIVTKNGETIEYSVNENLGIWLFLGAGLISTILGIGGGILHVPLMVCFLGFPPHAATSTSHLVIAAMSGAATLIQWKLGYLKPLAGIIPWLAGGVIIGAPFGALLSTRISGKLLIQLLAIALLLVSFRLLLLK